MTKAQYIANIILFLPLTILNFLMYGADGMIRFVKEIKKYSKLESVIRSLSSFCPGDCIFKILDKPIKTRYNLYRKRGKKYDG